MTARETNGDMIDQFEWLKNKRILHSIPNPDADAMQYAIQNSSIMTSRRSCKMIIQSQYPDPLHAPSLSPPCSLNRLILSSAAFANISLLLIP